jgi:hypothetical protein
MCALRIIAPLSKIVLASSRQQGGAVAGVDLDHRVAARSRVIDEHGRLDREASAVQRQRARLQRSVSGSCRDGGPHRLLQPLQLPRLVDTARCASLHQELSSAIPSSVVWMRASMMLPPTSEIAPAMR